MQHQHADYLSLVTLPAKWDQGHLPIVPRWRNMCVIIRKLVRACDPQQVGIASKTLARQYFIYWLYARFIVN